jgi:hypothetical protein
MRARWVRSIFVLSLLGGLVAGSVAASSPALATGITSPMTARPCVQAIASVDARHLHPGDQFSYELEVMNCSNRSLALLVTFSTRGPCSFDSTDTETVRLERNTGFGLVAAATASRCAGLYTIQVLVQRSSTGARLDAARASFTVHA